MFRTDSKGTECQDILIESGSAQKLRAERIAHSPHMLSNIIDNPPYEQARSRSCVHIRAGMIAPGVHIRAGMIALMSVHIRVGMIALMCVHIRVGMIALM